MEVVAFLLISTNPFSPFVADLRMSEVACFVFVHALALHEIPAPGGLFLFLRVSSRGFAASRAWSRGVKTAI